MIKPGIPSACRDTMRITRAIINRPEGLYLLVAVPAGLGMVKRPCLNILVSSQRASGAPSNEVSPYRNEEAEMQNHQLYTPGIHLRTTLSKTVWRSG